jgi:AraC-like DNA-binding protein
MTQSKHGKTRGILRPKTGEQKFNLTRILPSSELSPFIEQYWIVSWNLRGEKPYASETLPFPSVYIAIEKRHPEIYGVTTGRFTRHLKGSGQVFGVKFRPASFYPFWKFPISSLTNQTTSLQSVFGTEAVSLRKLILKESDHQKRVRHMETFLLARLPKRDTKIEEIRDVVEHVQNDRSITRVEQIASLMGISLRPLQRNFDKYVGVSPKWIIQRYRLQEAAELLANSSNQEKVSEIALSLGYFDQAHFTRDFKRVIGTSPSAYARKERSSR